MDKTRRTPSLALSARLPVTSNTLFCPRQHTCVVIPRRLLVAWDHGVGVNQEDVQQLWSACGDGVAAILQVPPGITQPPRLLHTQPASGRHQDTVNLCCDGRCPPIRVRHMQAVPRSVAFLGWADHQHSFRPAAPVRATVTGAHLPNGAVAAALRTA